VYSVVSAAALGKALELTPGYAAALFNLAVVERFSGRWSEAVDLLFRSFAAGHPAPEKTILQWAGAAVEAGRAQVALSLLERGAAAYPRSEDVVRALAVRRFQGKDCARAFDLLAPFAQSANRDTLNLLGLSELCLGHREAARAFLQRSLALDPAQPSVREALAFIEKGK
jgi:Flp pilus assembly protein TadD